MLCQHYIATPLFFEEHATSALCSFSVKSQHNLSVFKWLISSETFHVLILLRIVHKFTQQIWKSWKMGNRIKILIWRTLTLIPREYLKIKKGIKWAKNWHNLGQICAKMSKYLPNSGQKWVENELKIVTVNCNCNYTLWLALIYSLSRPTLTFTT